MNDNRATATREPAPETLLADLRALVAEAQGYLDESGGDANGETGSALRGRLEAARRRLAKFYQDARVKVAAGGKYADETIRAKPYQSMAVAAGVGLLLGVLLGRRDR